MIEKTMMKKMMMRKKTMMKKMINKFKNEQIIWYLQKSTINFVFFFCVCIKYALIGQSSLIVPAPMNYDAYVEKHSPVISWRSNWMPASYRWLAPNIETKAIWVSNRISMVQLIREDRYQSSKWFVRFVVFDMDICCLKSRKLKFYRLRKRKISLWTFFK